MAKPLSQFPFRPKRISVIERKLADELLLYNPKTARAYSLNEIATRVWLFCDGTKTVHQIVRLIGAKRDGSQVCAESVWLSLAKFARARLLYSPPVDIQRRLFLTKAGAIVSATAIPVIMSIIVPPAEAAVSCSTVGQPCNPRPCCPPLACVLNRCV
jgi:hypothetical protein